MIKFVSIKFTVGPRPFFNKNSFVSIANVNGISFAQLKYLTEGTSYTEIQSDRQKLCFLVFPRSFFSLGSQQFFKTEPLKVELFMSNDGQMSHNKGQTEPFEVSKNNIILAMLIYLSQSVFQFGSDRIRDTSLLLHGGRRGVGVPLGTNFIHQVSILDPPAHGIYPSVWVVPLGPW